MTTRDGTFEVHLDDDTVDRLAQRLAEALVPDISAPEPVEDADHKLTATEVAKRWGFDRSWVYQHSEQLGAIRPGGGRRPRLRFDPEVVDRAVAAMDGRATGPRVVRRRG